jgi:acetyl-CoA synthetase
MRFAREHLAPYKRVRRLEFAELPKTISGKIRRVELRTAEQERLPAGAPPLVPHYFSRGASGGASAGSKAAEKR